MSAQQHAAALKLAEILADRDLADAKALGQIVHQDFALGHQHVFYIALSFDVSHSRPSFRLVSSVLSFRK